MLKSHIRTRILLQPILTAPRGPQENPGFLGVTRFASFARQRSYGYVSSRELPNRARHNVFRDERGF